MGKNNSLGITIHLDQCLQSLQIIPAHSSFFSLTIYIFLLFMMDILSTHSFLMCIISLFSLAQTAMWKTASLSYFGGVYECFTQEYPTLSWNGHIKNICIYQISWITVTLSHEMNVLLNINTYSIQEFISQNQFLSL